MINSGNARVAAVPTLLYSVLFFSACVWIVHVTYDMLIWFSCGTVVLTPELVWWAMLPLITFQATN